MPATVIAFLAGGVYVLAFAPVGWSLLAFAALAVLFRLWLGADRPRQAFLIGWCFGLGQFGAGVSWIYVSLNTFGNMVPALAGLAVFLLVLALALFPALVGLLQHGFWRCPASIRLLSVMAPLWVLAEWVREWLLTGLPWLAAGYSQAENVVSALAPLGGVYLVSLAVVLIAAALVLASLRSYMPAIACAVVCLLGSWYVSTLEWTQATGRSLNVKLVQGNVGIFDKWNPDKSNEILKRYIQLGSTGAPADLVIWPEAAAPTMYSRLPAQFWQALESGGTEGRFMFGVLERDVITGNLYNAVVATGPDGGRQFYRKIHLVPFGEYLPLRSWLSWILEYLEIPMSDLSPYREDQQPLDIGGVGIGVSICYEDAFANVVRKDLPGAGLLVNLSEDAWFGDSLAPHQRLQMARMRARENGRTLVRVSNNGLSAVIDYQGRTSQVAPQFQEFVLGGTAEVRTGMTPFSAWGHRLALSILLALLLPGAVSLWRAGSSVLPGFLSEQK